MAANLKRAKGRTARQSGRHNQMGRNKKHGCRGRQKPNHFGSGNSLFATIVNYLTKTKQKLIPEKSIAGNGKLPASDPHLNETGVNNGYKKIKDPETRLSFSKGIAVINLEACTGCGICQDCCETGALIVDELAVVDPEKCNGCGACVPECPNEAISLDLTT